jgi:hypothetical protein
MRTALLWSLAAVAGVLLVAGVTAAASSLSTQTIGLSSEPLSAGDQLAPQDDGRPDTAATPTADERRAADAREARRRRRARARRERERAAATPTATPAAVPTVDDDFDDDNSGSGGDDDSGRGRGRGRGRGGDDD